MPVTAPGVSGRDRQADQTSQPVLEADALDAGLQAASRGADDGVQAGRPAAV